MTPPYYRTVEWYERQSWYMFDLRLRALMQAARTPEELDQAFWMYWRRLRQKGLEKSPYLNRPWQSRGHAA